MNRVNGVVKAVGNNGKTFCMDQEGQDVWFGCFKPEQMGGLAKGNSVTFTYKTNGKYNNVQGNVKVTAGSAPAAAPQASGGSSFSLNISREESICRQNALTNAVNFVSTDKDSVYSPHEVIEVAMQFAEYTTGELDKAAAQELANIGDGA